jgi:hypothetical protein
VIFTKVIEEFSKFCNESYLLLVLDHRTGGFGHGIFKQKTRKVGSVARIKRRRPNLAENEFFWKKVREAKLRKKDKVLYRDGNGP